MNKPFAAISTLLSVVFVLAISSCSKNLGSTYTEPITIVQPDSLSVQYVSRGTVLPITIAFTTDRPLLYAKCMYQIDSPAMSSYYPDTLFYQVLDANTSVLTNKYTYSGSFTVPNNIPQQSVIRFDVQFKAALNPSSPYDTVFEDKQFKMTVR